MSNEIIEKLASTLLKSGLESSRDSAMRRAKEILKIKDEPIENAKSLPKVDDLSTLDADNSLAELLDEDADTIYSKSKKVP